MKILYKKVPNIGVLIAFVISEDNLSGDFARGKNYIDKKIYDVIYFTLNKTMGEVKNESDFRILFQ